MGANVFIRFDQHRLEMEIRILQARCEIGHGHGYHHVSAVARYLFKIPERAGRLEAKFTARIPTIFGRGIQ